jgi:hypothetical protein
VPQRKRLVEKIKLKRFDGQLAHLKIAAYPLTFFVMADEP